MRFIYLHGFASSPSSRKARLFIDNLARHHIQLEALDLAPDFEHLTITSQLGVMESVIKGEPVALIGSSLGGYLAALYAVMHPEVDRLVLMAPAFDFHRLWQQELGPQKLEDWRKKGSVSIFHYGMGRDAALGYQLMDDAGNYPPFPDVQQPCLILHGRNDVVVPFDKSAQFAEHHPNVDLISLPSGHELTDVLDDIWKSASTFLGVSDTNNS